MLDATRLDPAIVETVRQPGALVWHVALSANVDTSRIVKSAVYPLVTIRNVNTVRKLHALMTEL